MLAYLPVYLGHLFAAQAIEGQYFVKEWLLNGFTAPHGLIGETHTRSLKQCGIECLSQSACASFFYVDHIDRCQLHDVVFNQTDGLIRNESAEYYISETSIPKTFACPPDDTKFRAVLLSDNTTLTYRAPLEIQLQHADAMTECGTLHRRGRLLQVLTEARYTFIQNLASCEGHSGRTFWIDGNNTEADNFTDISGWTTSDGKALPTHFWRGRQPDNPDKEHCLSMSFNLNNKQCSTSYNFVCELG